jgi:hypothetical protein
MVIETIHDGPRTVDCLRGDEAIRDEMLRRMTDRLVQSPHFKPATNSRIKRIQMAYNLACELEEDIRREVMTA